MVQFRLFFAIIFSWAASARSVRSCRRRHRRPCVRSFSLAPVWLMAWWSWLHARRTGFVFLARQAAVLILVAALEVRRKLPVRGHIRRLQITLMLSVERIEIVAGDIA